MTVIGVTGTKGKSTTIFLAGRILEGIGKKVGWISSLSIKVDEKEWLNPYHMTMPGRTKIQKYLRQMVKAGCQYALVEVTSEGILQCRNAFIDFDIAVFTNLAPEHIEAHGNFEKYRRDKGKFFNQVVGSKKKTIGIVNLDDASADYFLSFPIARKIGYQLESGSADVAESIVRPSDYALSESGSRFIIDGIEFVLNLPGLFNLYNCLGAIAIALASGVALDDCQKAVSQIKDIPGRMEEIKEGQNFRAIVDLAHTPDSFENVLAWAKKVSRGKVICVFGSAGGGRDKWKRPELGRIAANYCGAIILTNEDPYNEDPFKVIEQISEGIPPGFDNENLYKIVDRKNAIAKAVALAESGDILMVLGKGTEVTMVLGNHKIPWDDRQAVRDAIKGK